MESYKQEFIEFMVESNVLSLVTLPLRADASPPSS